ncbi:3-ketoacyl-ACP reductase [Chitinophaga filiformis]|uniref:3-oxoacyl-[acyl-carrier protein] reductase n=1 Tax=Chitinophaga filiformis TaxID=104663 RepID=A0A1G7TTH2_CHIFI|nr:3-ketoacyl-ACP reductase [Chitinophaga filiformis]SDG38567.1 3-oxoacyl-[acyl-carrier protein] reductase [Chitinophaga filiformis]
MESIKGKNALVTGAGKGIGKAVAKQLAAEGVNLALLARTEKDLQAVADELKETGVKVVYAVADVADRKAVEAAIAKMSAALGSIDILINNAGIGKFAKFLELEPEEWEQVIKVNLFGAYYVIRAVLPGMLSRQSGDIVNISSTAGQKGAPVTSAYSASKFGLIGMSESLMQEVRKSNIRVTTLTPSTIATDMAIELKLTDGNPEKVMQPEDFAELIVMQLKLNRRTFVKEAGL